MKKNILASVMLTCFACSGGPVAEEHTGTIVHVTDLACSAHADTIRLGFNILNPVSQSKEQWYGLNLEEVTATLQKKTIHPVAIHPLTGKHGRMPEQIIVSLLVDKSVTQAHMDQIRKTVKAFADVIPDSALFISFFDARTGITRPLSAATLETFEEEFVPSRHTKVIFDAALEKFRELAGDRMTGMDPVLANKIQTSTYKKYLVLLTDGQVDSNDQKTSDCIHEFSEYVQSVDSDPDNRHLIEIYAIRFGGANGDVDFTLSYLCKDIRNANVKGGAFIADASGVFEKMQTATDITQPDYELVAANPPGRIYAGTKQELDIRLVQGDQQASGQYRFAPGSLINPLQTGTGALDIAARGIGGIVFGLILYLIIQVLIPFLRYRFSNFDTRYVIKYVLEQDESRQCYYCTDDIHDGEEIVTKCHHVVHKHCWEENNHQCPEYGHNCTEGYEHHWDGKHLWGRANRPFYTSWALWGMTGGFITWILFQLSVLLLPVPFHRWFDGVPLMIAALCICWYAWRHPFTIWKRMMAGLLLAAGLSFLILLLSPWFGMYAVVSAFIVLGCGMGISFAGSRRHRHTYFLAFRDRKEREVAIHKWMSVAGGSQDVTIGKSEDCTLSMAWDDHPDIQPVQVRLYVDKKLKLPTLKVVADTLRYNKKTVRQNDECTLKNNDTFQIGDTTFRFLER